MAFIHGKKTAVFMGPYDFSGHIRQVGISASTNPIDTTTFANAGANNLKSWTSGLRDGSISIGGMWSLSDLEADDGAHRPPVAADQQIKTWQEAGTEFPVLVPKNTTANVNAPNGFLVPNGSPAAMITGLIQEYSVSSPVDDIVALDAEVMGASTSANVVGGTPTQGYTLCHNYCDGTLINTISTPFVWDGAATTARTSTLVEVSTADDHDFGAVIHVHVLDNTLDAPASIVVSHSTGVGAAEFGTDLLWPTAAPLAARTVGAKSVAFNPGPNDTDGHWQLTVTPTATPTAGGEISIIAAVSILSTALL